MKIKKILIPEHKYHSDFAPLAGFYDYNIKKKLVPLRLNDIQNMGVHLETKRNRKKLKT